MEIKKQCENCKYWMEKGVDYPCCDCSRIATKKDYWEKGEGV